MFSCIGYAMPFILCAMICCCLPCFVSIMGFREDMSHNRGATAESINALPTHKFKSKQPRNGEEREINSDSQGDGGILAAGTEKERMISAEDAVSLLYVWCCILSSTCISSSLAVWMEGHLSLDYLKIMISLDRKRPLFHWIEVLTCWYLQYILVLWILQVCCICLANYVNNDELRELPCAHYFHMECVDKWLKTNALCPLCKSEVGSTAGSSGMNSRHRQIDRRVGNGAELQQEI